MLTFVRSSELRLPVGKSLTLIGLSGLSLKKETYRWCEVFHPWHKDGKRRTYVLLSRQAVSIVKQLRELSGSTMLCFRMKETPKA